MSSGTPARATGIAAARSATYSCQSRPIRSAVALVISVWMKPGAIALAVTPNLPSSMASVLVKPCRPAFAVA
jgi:hypothetical protein